MTTVNITYACGHTKGLFYADQKYATNDIEKAKTEKCFSCKIADDIKNAQAASGFLSFPASRVEQFRYDPHSSVRWGQQFHQFMGLEKCVQDKEFCDKLYNADTDAAKAMVRERIDTSN